MIIGVPREIKDKEFRVGIVPEGVQKLSESGHTVLIESGAGIGSAIDDKEFAAAGAEIKPEWKLDGVNLLPFLMDEKKGSPHEALYWRFNIWTHKPDWDRWAIRQGDWVLVHNRVGHSMMGLYNITDDPGQENNLVRKHPDKTSEMLMKWRAWDALNVEGGSVE